MGKDLKGNELGKGFRQRPSGSYNLRIAIKGEYVNITHDNLDVLRKIYQEKTEYILRRSADLTIIPTLNEWFEFWCKNYKAIQIKPTSYRTIQASFKNIFGNFIGNMPINIIRNIDIQKCVNEYINKGKNASRLHSTLGYLKDCFELAVVNKLLNENPSLFITVPRAKQYDFDIRSKVLTPQEENLFLNTAEESWYYNAFYIMLNTGLRIGELCGLKWEDIDFNNKYINVQRQLICQYYKGKHTHFDTLKSKSSYRKIPFIGNVENILKQQYKMISDRRLKLKKEWRATFLDAEFSDLVFFTTMGSPMKKETFVQAIRVVLKNIRKQYPEFPHIHPHMFRHTFATKCYNAGVPAKVAQVLLGHQNTAITLNIYTHLSSENISNEAAKITSLLNNQKNLKYEQKHYNMTNLF